MRKRRTNAWSHGCQSIIKMKMSDQHHSRYRGHEAVKQHGEHGLAQNGPFGVLQAQNRAHGDDVVNGDHVSHRPADGLQRQQRAAIKTPLCGDGVLDGAEGEIRNGA